MDKALATEKALGLAKAPAMGRHRTKGVARMTETGETAGVRPEGITTRAGSAVSTMRAISLETDS